jgi:hypothetical protein
MLKSQEGISIEMLTDFAIFDGVAFSLELIKTFKKGDPLGGASSLGRLIMNYIDEKMLNRKKKRMRQRGKMRKRRKIRQTRKRRTCSGISLLWSLMAKSITSSPMPPALSATTTTMRKRELPVSSCSWTARTQLV